MVLEGEWPHEPSGEINFAGESGDESPQSKTGRQKTGNDRIIDGRIIMNLETNNLEVRHFGLDLALFSPQFDPNDSAVNDSVNSEIELGNSRTRTRTRTIWYLNPESCRLQQDLQP